MYIYVCAFLCVHSCSQNKWVIIHSWVIAAQMDRMGVLTFLK